MSRLFSIHSALRGVALAAVFFAGSFALLASYRPPLLSVRAAMGPQPAVASSMQPEARVAAQPTARIAVVQPAAPAADPDADPDLDPRFDPRLDPRFDPRAQTASDRPYDSPLELVLSADGRRLFVLCQQSDRVRVFDTRTYAERASIAVGHQPRGLALSTDGRRLLVANSWDDTLSVIDTRTLAATHTWTVGDEPSSALEDRSGQRIYVANRISGDIAVLDAHTGQELKRLTAGRGVSYLALSADGRQLYASHIYPNPTRAQKPDRNPARSVPQSELTVVDVASSTVAARIPLAGRAGLFHIALSRDGALGAVPGYHPKNLIPAAHVEHGGYMSYSLTLFGPAIGSSSIGSSVEIPLDDLERYSATPFDLAIAPDRSRIYLTASGSEAVVVLDLNRLLVLLRSRSASGSLVSDLSLGEAYIVARIPVGHNPRGLALSADGRTLYVANRLDDSLSLIDTRTLRVRRTLPIGGLKPVSARRRGEQTFYSARYSFQGALACASCHIDSTYDGMSWDLEPDGFGRDIVNNRLLEDLRGTEPYKWNGGNPSVPIECGPRTEKYFWRAEQYGPHTLADLSLYILSLPPRPNRLRPSGELTPAQQRGQALFTRATDRFGKPIPEQNRCSYCHSGPKGTSQKSFDVGTGTPTDNTGRLDTPQLTNLGLHPPYLHNGSARTLEEIWTLYNPSDRHGRTNDLTKDGLNDLIEYLRTR